MACIAIVSLVFSILLYAIIRKLYKQQVNIFSEQVKISSKQTEIMEQQNKIALFDKRFEVYSTFCKMLTESRAIIELMDNSNDMRKVKAGLYINLPPNSVGDNEYKMAAIKVIQDSEIAKKSTFVFEGIAHNKINAKDIKALFSFRTIT